MKTVKARIAVAVAASGAWHTCCYAYQDALGGILVMEDDEAAAQAVDGLDGDPYIVHFVEVELPLPEAKTIEGKVVKSEETKDDGD